MIKAELKYNPYLLETKVSFNGQQPRINSIVEKYQDGMLQDWVKDVPLIFYNEMNGYHFELEFSGTTRDFNEVQRAFNNANVSEDQVRLFHKNELGSREEKMQFINEMLEWLNNTPNSNFDNQRFREDNAELIEGAYTFIVVGGSSFEFEKPDWTNASVEYVSSAFELANTELRYSPIIYCLDLSNVHKLQNSMHMLLQRDDVDKQQLFFMIDSDLNKQEVFRLIQDLGINHPQILNDLNDAVLKKYFELYPETDYIIHLIKLLQNEAEDIESRLATENTQGDRSKSAVLDEASNVDDMLSKLKTVDEQFCNREKVDIPIGFFEAEKVLIEGINSWKKWKTTISDQSEAEKQARDLDRMVLRAFANFAQEIGKITRRVQHNINREMNAKYKTAEYPDTFFPTDVFLGTVEKSTIPSMESKLLTLCHKKKVKKKDLPVFMIKENDNKDIVETTYYCQEWRDYALKVVKPIADQVIRDHQELLSRYLIDEQQAFHKHIMELVGNLTEDRDRLSLKLSSEERQLQIDNDWLTTYKEKLKVIERG